LREKYLDNILIPSGLAIRIFRKEFDEFQEALFIGDLLLLVMQKIRFIEEDVQLRLCHEFAFLGKATDDAAVRGHLDPEWKRRINNREQIEKKPINMIWRQWKYHVESRVYERRKEVKSVLMRRLVRTPQFFSKKGKRIKDRKGIGKGGGRIEW
jgi:hypothetical protein